MNLEPIFLSIWLAIISTLCLVLIGVPSGYLLSRWKSPFKVVVESIISLPLILPPTVLGFYLLLAFSPNSLFGSFVNEHFGLSLAFSFEGLVVSSIIYSLPFMIYPIHTGFVGLPKSIEEASWVLGKSKFETFYQILLPNIRTSILTGVVLSFAHTMGEFGVVLMIGGNIPGETKVASIAIYDAVESLDYGLANAYSIMMIGISLIIMIMVFILNKRAFRLIK